MSTRQCSAAICWAKPARLAPYCADILDAFAGTLEASDDERLATLAAFRRWYASKRRTSDYFASACMAYLDLLDEKKQIQRYDLLPDASFANLCKLPDLGNYACHRTEEFNTRLAPAADGGHREQTAPESVEGDDD